MKKIFTLFFFAALFQGAFAQEDPQPNEKKLQEIEALKVAFISKELDLTPDEAQKFWPLYNQYSKEMRVAVKDDQDVLDRDEKVLNLRKRYKDQFVKVLGDNRVNRMYGAEGRFRQLLIKSIRKQRQQQQGVRPGNRRGNRL
ncbi:MAG: hypothetical protein ACOYKE_10890 [Ferruginibacter sp.]